MFLHHAFQERIFLIVRKRDAEYLGVRLDVGDQSAAAQLDIVGMGADKKDFLSVQDQVVIHFSLVYLVAINPPTTLVITIWLSRSTHWRATAEISFMISS